MEDQGSVRFPSCTNSLHLSYECIWTCRNLLTRAEIPHHSGRSECSPAHPHSRRSGVSNAEKWFVVYFLMRQGDMGICQLKLKQTPEACSSQPPTTVRRSSKKTHQQTRHSSHISIFWYERRLNAEDGNIQQIWTLTLKGEMPNSSKSSLNYIFPAALLRLLMICMPARTAPLQRHYE